MKKIFSTLLIIFSLNLVILPQTPFHMGDTVCYLNTTKQYWNPEYKAIISSKLINDSLYKVKLISVYNNTYGWIMTIHKDSLMK